MVDLALDVDLWRYRKKSTPLTLVINLDVPDDVILSRISDRWVHLPSGRVYNMSYNRPKVEGHDDPTGEPLVKRPDDNPVQFAHPTLFYALLRLHILGGFFPTSRAILWVHFSDSRLLLFGRSVPGLPNQLPQSAPTSGVLLSFTGEAQAEDFDGHYIGRKLAAPRPAHPWFVSLTARKGENWTSN